MRCAVLMPNIWRGGILNFGVLISNIISEIEFDGRSTEVSFCVPNGYNLDLIVGLNDSVNVITFDHAPYKADFAFRTFVQNKAAPSLKDVHGVGSLNDMTYPRASGGALDIVLADVWVLLTGLFNYGPIIPLKPYLVYAPDFIQRIVPEIYDDPPISPAWMMNAWQALALQRSAGVIVTSNQTGKDALTYAGVRPDKIHRLPMANAPLFKEDPNLAEKIVRKRKKIAQYLPAEGGRAPSSALPPAAARKTSDEDRGRNEEETLDDIIAADRPYFLWVTNTTVHKNQQRALQALERYYEEGGALRCVICGADTDRYRKPSQLPVVNAIYERLRSSPALQENAYLAGEVGNERFRQLLTEAAFLWHNVIYDNGTFSVIEAARVGTPCLVSAYPQMIEILEHFSIEAELFDPWDLADAARGLKAMEKKLAEGEPRAPKDIGDQDRIIFREKLADLLRGALRETTETAL
ncbi:glycosyltransferase [Methylocystis sp. 9N]|uniref:Glycosyltransferase n=1 Tax=Methylocystis borbori TaxID=3118750 RepID=A0ABU7XCN2_9HYPH